MERVAEFNNEDTKRIKFQVFKNVSFDSKATAKYCARQIAYLLQ